MFYSLQLKVTRLGVSTEWNSTGYFNVTAIVRKSSVKCLRKGVTDSLSQCKNTAHKSFHINAKSCGGNKTY
jgi:hypothetical protein